MPKISDLDLVGDLTGAEALVLDAAGNTRRGPLDQKADQQQVAAGTTARRPLQDRFADAINIEDFRYDASGIERSDDETVRAALLRVPREVEVGRPVRVGARAYTFGGSALSLLSKCSVEGVIGSTEFRVNPSNRTKNNLIFYDPTIAPADAAVAAAQAAGDTRPPAVIRAEVMPGIVEQIMANPLPDLHWRGIRFRGNWGLPDPANPGQFLWSESDIALVVIKCFERLTFEFCEWEGSRAFSCQPRIGRKAIFAYCKVEKSCRDGIAAWDVEDLIVTGCTFNGTTDDAVSAQCSTDTGTVLRSRVTVEGCHFNDCHGINGGAAKLLRIANCQFSRLHSNAWSIGVSTNGTTGETQNFCVDVSHVTVLDIIGRSWFINGDGASRPTAAMTIFNEHFQAAGLPAVPGYADPATGSVADNLPYYWLNRVELDDHPVGATKHIRISHFVIDRTRPAVAKYSDWKAETAGRADDPSGDNRYKAFGGPHGWLDYAVTDANLDGVGLDIRGPIWDLDVSHGYIGTRQKSVVLRVNPAVSLRDMLFQRMRFHRVVFRGALQDAVAVGSGEFATLTQQDIAFSDCLFDVDPEFRHGNRAQTGGKPNGAWTTAGSPFAINLPNIAGLRVERCRFKNCGQAINDAVTASLNYYRDNVLMCDPAGLNFNAGNKGIGVTRTPGDAYWYEIWDCDPTSPTFDTIQNQCVRQLNGSNGSISAQVTGKYIAGMRVRNLDTTIAPEGMAGDWIRRTTGTGHAVGTDWVQVWQSFGQGDTAYVATALLRGSGSTTPAVKARHSDAAVAADLQLLPQNASGGAKGYVRFGTLTATADAPVTGYIEVKDEAGTVRRLAVIG